MVYDDDYVIDSISEDEDDAPLSSKRKKKKSKYEQEASWDDEEVFLKIDVKRNGTHMMLTMSFF